MELFTTVTLPKAHPVLDIHSSVMFLGSCFADNVGEELRKRMGQENVCVNPFGVLYNPFSIHQALMLLARLKPDLTYDEWQAACPFLFKGQEGVWHSWLHSGLFSATTREECLHKTYDALIEGHNMLRNCDLLCITFGTTKYYTIAEPDTGGALIVANCHKEPQRFFREVDGDLNEAIEQWQQLLTLLHQLNPKMKVCFTVSPYRYRKYGLHESQLQKAKLLLLCDSLITSAKATAISGDTSKSSTDRLFYFPSYEIQLDELRDYRFYNPDMLHPSEQAVAIITERFVDWTFTSQLRQLAEKNMAQWRHSQHRTIVTNA